MANKSVRFACPNCKKRLKAARPEQSGQTTRCPFCGLRITVPLPANGPHDGAGDGRESTIQMSSYEGRETDHLPSQPAKNPLIYALSGALVVLLVGGGLLAAYMMGQSGAGQGKPAAVAASAQSPADAVGDQDQVLDRSAPRRPNLGNQAGATSLPGTKSGKQGASSPSSTAAGVGPHAVSNNGAVLNSAGGVSKTQGPQQGDPVVQPESGSDERLLTDDSNRPQKDPIDLIQPAGAEGVDTSQAVTAVIVEVPVFIPANYNAADSSSKTTVIPDLSVVIRPEDVFATVMKVDHLSNPGISTKLVISLDKTPATEVQVTVSADSGLVVDPTSLTFAANVAPIQQVLAITGDGNADMRLGPSKVFYVHVVASGGGLTANSPAQIPVQVLRRNSFLMTNGLSIRRSDATSPKNATPVLSNWTFNVNGTSPILIGEQYTAEYVQLKGKRARFRFYDDRIELEQPTGSGTYQSRVTGSWE